jgi:hypothetical protein
MRGPKSYIAMAQCFNDKGDSQTSEEYKFYTSRSLLLFYNTPPPIHSENP